MITAKNSNEQTALDFVQAYGELDMQKIEACLADNVVAHITNKHAEVDNIVGRKAYMQRQAESNTTGVDAKLTVPQIITINTGQVMLMVNIEVTRGKKTMHNHAAFLLTVIDNKITEMWMVEALPAHSDSFWKE